MSKPLGLFCDADDPELAILALGFIFVPLGKEEGKGSERGEDTGGSSLLTSFALDGRS